MPDQTPQTEAGPLDSAKARDEAFARYAFGRSGMPFDPFRAGWEARRDYDAQAHTEGLDVDAFLKSLTERHELSAEWREGIEYARLKLARAILEARRDEG